MVQTGWQGKSIYGVISDPILSLAISDPAL